MATASSGQSQNGPEEERYDDNHPLTKIPHILPHERVFPIQIGTELFKLSGASISSDAPSYFSQSFLCQLEKARLEGQTANTAQLKPLYIDRDPATFRDISLHLQGYHIKPRDGQHFVRLFADAQFYTLPKLLSQLYEAPIFISIGGREFQFPRGLFSDPGNSPNYFTVGFTYFFTREADLFPGLDRSNLIRPPSIVPPSVPSRSADTFAQLLTLLQGYPLQIRSDEHRAELLRDARYFHFKGLEQRLIPCERGYSQARGAEEIVLRLENVQKSGLSLLHAAGEDNREDAQRGKEEEGPWHVRYARPYIDNEPAELVLEIGGEATKLHHDTGSKSTTTAEFFNDAKTRMLRLVEVLANKLPDGTRLSGNDDGRVKVSIDSAADVMLDGQDCDDVESLFVTTEEEEEGTEENPRKRRRVTEAGAEEGGRRGWIVKTGQWRIKLQRDASSGGVECVLVAVKLDAVSSERGHNKRRGFLGS